MPKLPLIRAALAALLLQGGLSWAQADGSPPGGSLDWLDKPYGYLANNESLRALLYEFGTTLGVPVIVSTKINVVADDEIPAMPAEEFLAEVQTRFGLIWVYDGTTLYLYDGGEAKQETVDFPFALRDLFKTTLDGASIRGAPLNWIFLPAENSLQLSGPPRFVEWGQQVARDIAARSPGDGLAPGDNPAYVIRIFEVEYGYVDQMANHAAGGKAPIVSLAEMVAKLMNVAHVSSIAGPAHLALAAGSVPKLRGAGVIGDGSAESQPQPQPQPMPAGVVGTRGAGQEAFVIGDPRLNAVIVRDTAQRMPTYERLIKALDSPVDQIEIAISVLDIDASAAEELRFELESDSFQVNAGADDGGSSIYYSENLWDVEGIALRIRALRNSGKSRILTRPSVTTLDNHEASFQNNRTFYVRLGGNDAEAVDLAPVSYGWVVRIRPHVIYESDHNRVQLAIHIEDGNRGGANLAVTGVPEVAQNVIQTQAVVEEGSTLLIGGYTVREQTRFDQRIPLLGRIPIMGRLFSTKVDRDQSVARYFLITPTILPAMISYEINTGFEGEPLDAGDAVKPVAPSADVELPEPTRPPGQRVPVERQDTVPRGLTPGRSSEKRGELHAAAGFVAEPFDTGRSSVPQTLPQAPPAMPESASGGTGSDAETGLVAAADASPATPMSGRTGMGALDAYPPDNYAVQVIALSSAERLEAFVAANDLGEMLRIENSNGDRARYVLLEGVYPGFSAAKSAAERIQQDGRFGVPYVRTVASLHAVEASSLVAEASAPGGPMN